MHLGILALCVCLAFCSLELEASRAVDPANSNSEQQWPTVEPSMPTVKPAVALVEQPLTTVKPAVALVEQPVTTVEPAELDASKNLSGCVHLFDQNRAANKKIDKLSIKLSTTRSRARGLEEEQFDLIQSSKFNEVRVLDLKNELEFNEVRVLDLKNELEISENTRKTVNENLHDVTKKLEFVVKCGEKYGFISEDGKTCFIPHDSILYLADAKKDCEKEDIPGYYGTLAYPRNVHEHILLKKMAAIIIQENHKKWTRFYVYTGLSRKVEGVKWRGPDREDVTNLVKHLWAQGEPQVRETLGVYIQRSIFDPVELHAIWDDKKYRLPYICMITIM